MSILKKLFGSSHSEKTESKTTLQELFEINLSSIPDNTFITGTSQTNSVGSPIINLHKRLDYFSANYLTLLK